VAWDQVAYPKYYGGLGIPNLQLLNLALRCHWVWLQKVDSARAWAEFDIRLLAPAWRSLIQPQAMCLAIASELGSGLTVGSRDRGWLILHQTWLRWSLIGD
jgi:hypothetical protein